jgi:membrane-associated protein
MMLEYLTPLLSSPWLYVVVFAVVAIDGFFPVVPSDVAVIGLGALSVTGSPNLVALAAVVVAGGIVGDRVTYLIGRKAGGRFTDGRLAVVKRKAERPLMRYGGVVILVGRFLPYGRTAIALTAGSMSVPLGRFRLFTALASVAWAVYAIGLGRLGGATFAGSPLLGAGCAMVIGTILTSVFALGGKWRGTATSPASRDRDGVPDPAPGRELSRRWSAGREADRRGAVCDPDDSGHRRIGGGHVRDQIR